MTKSKKTIGILGGLGPQATMEVFNKITKLLLKRNSSSQDMEYPNIIVYSLATVDYLNSKKSERSKLKGMIKGLKIIEKAGADFVIIPCNTVHANIENLQKEINIPIINMIEEVVEAVLAKKSRKIAILGTNITLKQRLYQDSLEPRGVQCFVPDNEKIRKVGRIITKIVKGKDKRKDQEIIINCINELVRKGAEGVVLGCTELSLIVKQADVKVPVFDSLEILAKTTVEKVSD